MRGIQPARASLVWSLSTPQWRCTRGCWNDVTEARCHGHSEAAPFCEACGGDGHFERPDGSEQQCEACAGYGTQWDWPKEGARQKEPRT